MRTAPSILSPRETRPDARRAAGRGVAPVSPPGAIPANFQALGGLAGKIVQQAWRARERAQIELNRQAKLEKAMRAEACANCHAPVDPAADPECRVEIGNMRRLTKVETICQSCRERLLEQREIADAAAALHEDASS
jgi:RNase P subunit RPR2